METECLVYGQIGITYYELNQANAAIESLEKCLEMSRFLKNFRLNLDCLICLSKIKNALAKREKTNLNRSDEKEEQEKQIYKEALKFAEKVGDKQYALNCVASIGIMDGERSFNEFAKSFGDMFSGANNSVVVKRGKGVIKEENEGMVEDEEEITDLYKGDEKIIQNEGNLKKEKEYIESQKVQKEELASSNRKNNGKGKETANIDKRGEKGGEEDGNEVREEKNTKNENKEGLKGNEVKIEVLDEICHPIESRICQLNHELVADWEGSIWELQPQKNEISILKNLNLAEEDKKLPLGVSKLEYVDSIDKFIAAVPRIGLFVLDKKNDKKEKIFSFEKNSDNANFAIDSDICYIVRSSFELVKFNLKNKNELSKFELKGDLRSKITKIEFLKEKLLLVLTEKQLLILGSEEKFEILYQPETDSPNSPKPTSFILNSEYLIISEEGQNYKENLIIFKISIENNRSVSLEKISNIQTSSLRYLNNMLLINTQNRTFILAAEQFSKFSIAIFEFKENKLFLLQTCPNYHEESILGLEWREEQLWSWSYDGKIKKAKLSFN